MSRKYILATTLIGASLVTLAGCQASFQAGSGSAASPSAGPAAATAAPTATAPAATTQTATPAATSTATTTDATAAKSKTTVVGAKIVPPGTLSFDSATATLLTTTDNDAILSDLKLFLEQNPKVSQVRIEGHANSAATADANLELSGQRALAVKKALAAKGVATERLLAVGFGDKKPAADSAQNQRIDFRVATLNGKNYLNQDPTAGGKKFE
jgi:OmpA-OmpF porin, OOP family